MSAQSTFVSRNLPNRPSLMCSGSQLILALFASISSLNCDRADEPALARILNERILFGPPAERIVVDVLLLMKQQPALFQIADDVLVAIFDPAAAAVFGAFVGEFAVGANGIDSCRPDALLIALALR